jgi:hypothetical protein
MMRWADQRFAHRFADGPAPWKPPASGAARVRYEWREWGKCVLASGIACAVMLVLIFLVSSPDHTRALWSDMMPRLGVITAIWLIWPVSRTFGKEKTPTSS